MTPAELEAKYNAILGDQHPNDLNLDKLPDDSIFALLAWELWKDGVDWDQGIPDIATGKTSRAIAVRSLIFIFSYGA